MDIPNASISYAWSNNLVLELGTVVTGFPGVNCQAKATHVLAIGFTLPFHVRENASIATFSCFCTMWEEHSLLLTSK